MIIDYLQSNRNYSELILHPDFIREVLSNMRLFVEGGLHLLRVAQPHTGATTALRAAMAISCGSSRLLVT